jgi:phosphate transport system substrate-binding protein
MKEPTSSKTVLTCLKFVLFLPLSSFFVWIGDLFGSEIIACLLWPLVLTAFYLISRKKLIPPVIAVNGILAGVLILAFTVSMILAGGNTASLLMKKVFFCAGFLYPGMIVFTGEIVLLLVVLTSLSAFFLSVFLQKRAAVLKKAAPALAAAVICIAVMGYCYANSDLVRYGGHGFKYMHGYSSTDFAEYTVYYEPSKLVKPDSPAEIFFEGEENMPKLDGAEACYPLYAAAAKAVYRNIGEIERSYLNDKDIQSSNGKIVRFTNTVRGFWCLIYPMKGEYTVDLFFGARPSEDQLKDASWQKVDLEITPIGREAFIFFVEPDNPVTDLTSDQLRQIYHGSITNWAQVGGKDQEICAFQRPKDSGSQTMMQYFMGDVTLKAPKTYEYVMTMGDGVDQVAQYANEEGAIGYSFRYFVEDLHQEGNVRVLSVDGIPPTLENIKNGTYSLSVDLCLISRKNDPNPNVQKMIDFMLSDTGQEIVEKTGYAGVR